MVKIIQANLNKTITFYRDNQEIVVPVDSIVTVYVNDGYAVWHGIHFDIFQDEYSLTV